MHNYIMYCVILILIPTLTLILILILILILTLILTFMQSSWEDKERKYEKELVKGSKDVSMLQDKLQYAKDNRELAVAEGEKRVRWEGNWKERGTSILVCTCVQMRCLAGESAKVHVIPKS